MKQQTINDREADLLSENRRLYERLTETPDLEGNITFNGRFIRWERPCPGKRRSVYLEISLDTVEVYTSAWHRITHWHPEDEGGVDELYALLCDAGRPGHCLVARSWLLGDALVFVGERAAYEATRKRYWWMMGRTYMFES